MTKTTGPDSHGSEAQAHLENVKGNDRFVMAMAKAMARKKEKARLGTHVDNSAPLGARRFASETLMSGVGSPAAMCAGK